MPEKTAGVVLFQLGGPDSPEAIEPFLYNLFCDPDIIDLPLGRWARPALARLISTKRAKYVAHHYAAIGGCSPIRRLTEQQAVALEAELNKSMRARVVVAMRYWHPFTQQALAELQAADVDELVLLPLYPQYSKTTTGSSINEWKRWYTPQPDVAVHTVQHFYDHPLYIQSLVEKVEAGMARFDPSAEVHMVFSAHGVPVKVVQAGDAYASQIEETTRLVMEAGGWRHPYQVCYQSKVGSGRWLQPTLTGVLRELGARGVKNVFVVPVSFVTDHVETLNEVDIEAREEAARAGIERFEMMEALNSSPTFIAALAGLVLEKTSHRVTEPQRDAQRV